MNYQNADARVCCETKKETLTNDLERIEKIVNAISEFACGIDEIMGEILEPALDEKGSNLSCGTGLFMQTAEIERKLLDVRVRLEKIANKL